MNGPSGHDGHSHDGHAHDFGHGIGTGYGVHGMIFGGHHAGMDTVEGFAVGFAFGPTGHFGMSVSSAVDMGGSFHSASGSMEGNGPSFEGPIDDAQKTLGILGLGVGANNIEAVLRASAIKNGLAYCNNLQLPGKVLSPAQIHQGILPINYRPAPLTVSNPIAPAHSYPGATGQTAISRTNWQIGERSVMEALRGIPARRQNYVRTSIEAELTTWHYAEADDYEIRLMVRIHGGNDKAELRATLAVAHTLCQDVLKAIKKSPPSAAAAKWRREHLTA